MEFSGRKTSFWGHQCVELVGAQSPPTQLRPFARHLIGKMVIQAAHHLRSQKSSWWFFTNPSEKYAQVKLEKISPNRGENKTCLKPPPRNLLP